MDFLDLPPFGAVADPLPSPLPLRMDLFFLRFLAGSSVEPVASSASRFEGALALDFDEALGFAPLQFLPWRRELD